MDPVSFKFESPIKKLFIIRNQLYVFVDNILAIMDTEDFTIKELLDNRVFQTMDHVRLSEDKSHLFIENMNNIYKFNTTDYSVSIIYEDVWERFNFDKVISNNGEIIVFNIPNSGRLITYKQTLVYTISIEVESVCTDDNNVYYFAYYPEAKTGDDYYHLFKYNVITNKTIMSEPFTSEIEHYCTTVNHSDMVESNFKMIVNTCGSQLYALKRNYLFVYNLDTLELIYKRLDVDCISKDYSLSHHKKVVNIYNITYNVLIYSFKLDHPYRYDSNIKYKIFNDIIALSGDGGEHYKFYSINGFACKDTSYRENFQDELQGVSENEKCLITQNYNTVFKFDLTHYNIVNQIKTFVHGEYSGESTVYNFMNDALFDANLVNIIFKFMPKPGPRFQMPTVYPGTDY